jgi:hypothetical protein
MPETNSLAYLALTVSDKEKKFYNIATCSYLIVGLKTFPLLKHSMKLYGTFYLVRIKGPRLQVSAIFGKLPFI